MAKKGQRLKVALVCLVCQSQNYITSKSKQLKEKLVLRKYCNRCRRHTDHKETKKLD